MALSTSSTSGMDWTGGNRSIQVVMWDPAELDAILHRGRQALKKAMYQLGLHLAGLISKEAPVDTGILQNASSWLVEETGEFDIRVYTPIEYALYVHEGTRPHAAPFEPIAIWAGRHGLEPGAVWHNILMYGTAPNNFADRAVEQFNQVNTSQFLAAALNEVGA